MEKQKKSNSIFPKAILEQLERDCKDLDLQHDGAVSQAEYDRARNYRARARKRFQQALRDIVWYLETQDEKQVEQALGLEEVKSLVAAVLGLNCAYMKRKVEEKEKDSEYVVDGAALKTILTVLSIANRAVVNILDPNTLAEVKLSMPVEYALSSIGNIVSLERMMGLSAYRLRETMFRKQ